MVTGPYPCLMAVLQSSSLVQRHFPPKLIVYSTFNSLPRCDYGLVPGLNQFIVHGSEAGGCAMRSGVVHPGRGPAAASGRRHAAASVLEGAALGPLPGGDGRPRTV